MEQRILGRSGLKVSAVGLGCNNFGGRCDAAQSRRVIDQAIESGIMLFDTADVYGNRGGSESIIGDALGKRRDQIVLATKFAGEMDDSGWKQGASRRYIVRAVEASLQRLKTDYIDLYQVHRPDEFTPIEETLGALGDLIHSGKVRYIGCSNFAAWQVAEAQLTAKLINTPAFISCQDEYSLVKRDLDSERIPVMCKYNLGLLPYFPLAGGMLTGKYARNAELPEGARLTLNKGMADRYFTDANWVKVEALQEFARQRGHSLLDLAFSWLASQPVVASVIAGATKPEQVEENVRAASWKLSADERAQIDAITA